MQAIKNTLMEKYGLSPYLSLENSRLRFQQNVYYGASFPPSVRNLFVCTYLNADTQMLYRWNPLLHIPSMFTRFYALYVAGYNAAAAHYALSSSKRNKLGALRPGLLSHRACALALPSTLFGDIHAFLFCIMPESPYFIAGFWVIILHFLQLLVAKYTRKENE